MKKWMVVFMSTVSLLASAFTLTSEGLEKGYFKDKYGKHGTEFVNGMPSLSIPFEWKDAPKGTKSFALVMEDYDAIPVVGFSWIHWVTLIPGTYNSLVENASQNDKKLVQGVNSWLSPLGNLDKETASHFGGAAPPDADHTYTVKIYALSKEINLKEGFYLNELYKEMEGKILGETILKGNYKK
ncbi:MAG: YbhB/YbcL family Raf kinase inhibitor-like protein [Fusobacteriaceae bacterium]